MANWWKLHSAQSPMQALNPALLTSLMLTWMSAELSATKQAFKRDVSLTSRSALADEDRRAGEDLAAQL